MPWTGMVYSEACCHVELAKGPDDFITHLHRCYQATCVETMLQNSLLSTPHILLCVPDLTSLDAARHIDIQVL